MSQLISAGENDFDFFTGQWQVSHRRLKERLVGCNVWEEFSGACVVQKILGGFGNVDDNEVNLPSGAYRAVTLRSYDREARRWSIWWLDGRHPGNIDVPVVGRFENGIGTFYANDTFAGKPIRVRFLWTLPALDKPRWAQAFSTDSGDTWETNWIMDFVRVSASAADHGC